MIFNIPISMVQLIKLIPVGIIICFFGGSFGVLVLGNLSSQRTANQLFPFLIFPQFFLAGVFSPIKSLPSYLFVLSRLAPMTYAVDFIRGVYYWGTEDYDKIVLHNPAMNLLLIGIIFVVFITIGTYQFMKNERNK